jgi:putative solute:sodium symporter small subunit
MPFAKGQLRPRLCSISTRVYHAVRRANAILPSTDARKYAPVEDHCSRTTSFARSVDSYVHRGGAMADLTEQQKQEYWRYNVTLTVVLLIIWFVVTYLISGLWAGWLNQFSFLGFPLGYYMAAQGSLAIFVIEIAVYAYLMNKLDLKYGIREEG